jgi:hypothetical protein
MFIPRFDSPKEGCPVPIKDFQDLLSCLSWKLVIVVRGLKEMVQATIANPIAIIEKLLTDLVISFVVEVL